jgi:hypothetical protein
MQTTIWNAGSPSDGRRVRWWPFAHTRLILQNPPPLYPHVPLPTPLAPHARGRGQRSQPYSPARGCPRRSLDPPPRVRRSKLCRGPSVRRSKLRRRLALLLFVSRACSAWVGGAKRRRITPLRATVTGRGHGRWPAGGEEAEVVGEGAPVHRIYDVLSFVSIVQCC